MPSPRFTISPIYYASDDTPPPATSPPHHWRRRHVSTRYLPLRTIGVDDTPPPPAVGFAIPFTASKGTPQNPVSQYRVALREHDSQFRLRATTIGFDKKRTTAARAIAAKQIRISTSCLRFVTTNLTSPLTPLEPRLTQYCYCIAQSACSPSPSNCTQLPFPTRSQRRLLAAIHPFVTTARQSSLPFYALYPGQGHRQSSVDRRSP